MSEAAVRLRSPQRVGQQVVFTIAEDSLPPEHPARLFWTAFGSVDLSPFSFDAKAVEGRPGRDRLDPRMLLTLWAFAFWDGVLHAREIERRIGRDLAYRWIVGDLVVSRSKLSEFLAANRDAMVELFCDLLASLLHAGLLFLPTHHVAQDGMKVIADAATRSFRTAPGLADCHAQATLHLKAVLARMDEEATTARAQSAQARHARAILDRVARATAVAQQLAAARKAAGRPQAEQDASRGSTTDPEARVMKMAQGGGFAPGHNVQLCAVGSGRGGPLAIVGVQVTSHGNDRGSIWPMRDRVSAYLGLTPTELVVDSDHLDLDDLRRADREGLALYSTVPATWNPTSRYQDDTTRAWMAKMATPEARETYRERKAISERPHAFFKGLFSLRRMPVRGAANVETFFVLASLVFTIHEHRKHWLH